MSRNRWPVGYEPRHLPPGQPLLHPESYSLARRFDGVDDTVEVAIGACNLTGAMTIAMLARRPAPLDTFGADVLPIRHFNAAGTKRIDVGINFSTIETLYFEIGGVTKNSASKVFPEDGWVIIVFTRAAGAVVTPRFHIYKNSTWIHEDSVDGTLANPLSQAGGKIEFTTWIAFGGYVKSDLAVLGEWGAELSDGQVEELSTNQSTLDWFGNTAGTPAGLWQFNQSDATTAITDLSGNGADQTAITGTEVLTTGPLNWTYMTNPVVESGIPTLVRHLPVAA